MFVPVKMSRSASSQDITFKGMQRETGVSLIQCGHPFRAGTAVLLIFDVLQTRECNALRSTGTPCRQDCTPEVAEELHRHRVIGVSEQ